jgi:hypothetical protein
MQHSICKAMQPVCTSTSRTLITGMYSRLSYNASYTKNKRKIKKAVPFMIQLDSVLCPSILFPVLIITFDNNTAITLAAVAVNELHGQDGTPLIFRSYPMLRVLESHNWPMATISDTFRLLSNSTTKYVFGTLVLSDHVDCDCDTH